MIHEDPNPSLAWSAERGEEIETLAEAFCDHFGGCASCPGVSSTLELGIHSEKPRTVFCTHWCHQCADRV